MKRRKIAIALRPQDLAVDIDEIITTLTAIKSLYRHREDLRLEFEYDDIGKPVFYVVYNYDETPQQLAERINFEADFGAILKRSVARAY